MTREPIKTQSAATGSFPKVCSKCAYAHSAAEWYALPYVGTQMLDDTATLELRNCACGSTISIRIGANDAP